MDREEFLTSLRELLETDSPLTGSEELSSFGSWDSMAVISFMAVVDDKWGITLSPKKISGCKTIEDLLALLS